MAMCLCLVSFLVKVSLSCSCLPTHLQTDVCQADFAIQATVLSVENSDEYTLSYKVTVHENFTTGKPKPNSVIYILTADNSALCGVSFIIGETYLIVGNVVQGKYRTNSCRGNLKLSALSQFQMSALKTKLYVNNCECEVVLCHGTNCESKTEVNCPINLSSSRADCYNHNEACTKTGSLCSWTNTTCTL
uniref:Metalloproteinase inhibitor 3-like n=1 Tax=Crassostrea virginica TaxID=6565 RepID=A0A8B8AYH6_CRAVI|nr:metalloproteinase inhibitor 3-like [Crassostrea virginica]